MSDESDMSDYAGDEMYDGSDYSDQDQSGYESNPDFSRDSVRSVEWGIEPDVSINLRNFGASGMRIVGGGDPDHVIVPPILQPPTYYDQSLTPAHQYLGDGLQEATGRTVFEEGAIHTIPVIFLRLNLMPGQILPIIACSSSVQRIVKYVMTSNRCFGVSYKLNEKDRTFGTIAEIFEHSLSVEAENSPKLKAMGHQRYEILSVEPFPESLEQNIVLARVKILLDIKLNYPFKDLCLHPKKHSLKHSELCQKKDMWQTQWPGWVYKQFDVNLLSSRLNEKVKMLYKDVKISDDPCLLSFQVLKLGMFDSEQVSYLLGVESTNLRLQHELNFWDKKQSKHKFYCAKGDCQAPVCNMSSVFSMSPEGPQGTYCNSYGQIHDMITVTELDDDMDVIAIGLPSSECCWFPGYRWVIILCQNCQSHLGWRYIADLNSSLMPRIFYGLSVRSIRNVLGEYHVDSLDTVDNLSMLVTF